MKRKLRSKKGFTLAEALISVAILAMLISMAAVGTSGMFGTGEQMMTVAKAAVLGSDVMQAVTNELRFGEDFEFPTEGGTAVIKKTFSEKDYPKFVSDPKEPAKTFEFVSSTYGECSIKVSDGSEKVNAGGPNPGKVTLKAGNLIFTRENDDAVYIPISTAAYDEVRIGALNFTCTYDKKTETVDEKSVTTYNFRYITVHLEITDLAGENVLWSNDVNICPLYLKAE